MADFRANKLPNLKISVENTESSNESEEELDFIDDTEESVNVVEANKSEESEDEGDVEFNVRIGSNADPTSKTEKKKSSSRLEEDKKPASKKRPDSSKVSSIEEIAPPVIVPEKRVYENKQGSFVTGVDITSKEAQAKREQRARRFRIDKSDGTVTLDDVQALYTSLGVAERDFDNEEKGVRGEVIHLRGTDDMTTDDVFEYFTRFPARFIEWINDTSCNVVWEDKATPVRAFLSLSRSHEEVEEEEEKKKKEEEEKKTEKQRKEKSKEPENKDEEMEEEGKGDAPSNKNKANSAGAATNKDKSTGEATAEKMDVDEDELDLMVDDDDEALIAATSSKEEQAEKEKNESKKKGTNKETSGEKSAKKAEEKKKKKKDKKEDGEDSDSSSSSSSSSSSGSSSSSSGSSSSGSGSSSDSDSSSGSSSDSSSSSSSSDSESEDDEKKSKKKQVKKAKRDAGTGLRKKKRSSVPWPPGKWRLGVQCARSRYLFMRYATQDDKKELGAEKKSQFYRKYGNPNYGGMKGLISKSRKRRLRNEEIDKIVKRQGPDAREAIDRKRADRRRPGDGEEGEVSNDDDIFAVDEPADLEAVLEQRERRVPFRRQEEERTREKPKDLRQLLKREAAAPSRKRGRDEGRSPMVTGKKRQRMEMEDEDDLDLDAELQELMGDRPVKKRPMGRMHADEEEEKIRAQRNRTGMLTVVAAEQSRRSIDSSEGRGIRSRLGGRLAGRIQLPAGRESNGARGVDSLDSRFPNSEEEEEEGDYEEEEGVGGEEEMDDYARELQNYRKLRNLPAPSKASFRPKITAARSSFKPAPDAVVLLDDEDEEEEGEVLEVGGGGDLRSRLGGAQSRLGDAQSRLGGPPSRLGGGGGKRSFPAMRIEVLDDD